MSVVVSVVIVARRRESEIAKDTEFEGGPRVRKGAVDRDGGERVRERRRERERGRQRRTAVNIIIAIIITIIYVVITMSSRFG